MSASYIPDNDATAGDPWNTAFLSDRDVSGQVPINFVSHPGVFLQAACFGNGTYEDFSFKECFSNLLASEFRRFVFDLYWDSSSRLFRLCPVEIPPQLTNATDGAASMQLMQYAIDGAYSSNAMTGATLALRQLSTGNATTVNTPAQSSVTATVNTSNSTTTSLPLIPTIQSSSGTTLYQLGPYRCSASLGLDTIVGVLNDYSRASSNEILARLQFVIFNLHASSTVDAPTVQSGLLSQSQLPNSTEVISTKLPQLGSLVYSPLLLKNERENLNASWFGRGSSEYFPLSNYFTTRKYPSGDIYTPDGWPCEDYLLLQQGYRFLVGYGSVSSQMSDYDFEQDDALIFPPDYLQSQRNATLDSTGAVSSGCFFNASLDQVDQVNSSWSVSSVMNLDQAILGNAADNLTLCGISPILNDTLDNRPASVNYMPYQAFGNQALFGWASGEPRNATEAGETSAYVQWRCAILVANDDYRGHWRVADCQKKYRAACKEANSPYSWTISTEAVLYNAANALCTGNSSFDVPRTGLENLYLYNHIQSISVSQADSSLLNGVWMNFNSLDVEDCWITGGANGTCPYRENKDAIRTRTILVPTIAAFITLLITALTILVRCNANRRRSRVRKRGEGGWDYEGVPS